MNLMIKTTAAAVLAIVATSCSSDKNSPGVEYMPDMYRSPAVEAYVDYENIESLSVRKPVEGTIANTGSKADAWINFPYAYQNTTEGYEAAGAELKSPLKTSEISLAKGKDLYEKFCMHCHGEKGNGDGAVVTNGGYPPPPAYSGPLKTLPEGKMFHTITYGKGQMGSHASQLNKKERWLVIQYVKALQNNGERPDLVSAEASEPTSENI